MNSPTLHKRISHFYDNSTQIWLDNWGEHMHHGYYGPAGDQLKNHQQAQIDLIEAMLQWANITNAKHIADLGCGVGGSARYLAKKFNAKVLGITLSKVQQLRAQEFTNEQQLTELVRVKQGDMMELKFTDGPFDLIWLMESAEHIADKRALIQVLYDSLLPGGKFIMATWCHRDPTPPLSQPEEQLLEGIYKYYHLPPMITIPQFSILANEVGFQKIKTADWSEAVAPFWTAVIRSAFNWKAMKALIRAKPTTLRGAWAMRYMQQGYKKGLIKFGVIQGMK